MATLLLNTGGNEMGRHFQAGDMSNTFLSEISAHNCRDPQTFTHSILTRLESFVMITVHLFDFISSQCKAYTVEDFHV